MSEYVGREMMKTPWGDASTLRDRRLSPGRGMPREAARKNQRERLFAATVAVTAEKGYAGTSVTDLVKLSGVSSRSFYQLFEDKEDCFLATMEEILGNVQGLTEHALEKHPYEARQAHRAVGTFVAMVAAQPAAAKLAMVSAFCAGEAPRERVIRAVSEFSQLIQRGWEALPDRDGMPAALTQAILGGVAVVLYRRLAEDRVEELGELAARLDRWVLSIPPPPRSVKAKPRRRRRAGAPGPHPVAAQVPAEGVLRCFAALVAEQGFSATTVADVAARARISQNTFYKHFRDKAHAFEALLDSSGAQMTAAALPAVRRNPEWPAAVRVALESVCAFLAAEPDFARVREVEVYAVGPKAVAQRDRVQAEIVRTLGTVAEPAGEFDPIAVEATVGAFQSLLYTRLTQGRQHDLTEVPPLVTYLALAPTRGAEEAWEVACG
jgi:AcrR family transcriptional regulator